MSTKGHFGIKSLKKSNWWYIRPQITVVIPILKDSKKVITMWLVKAIPKGVILNILQTNKKKKIENKKGIKGVPLYPIWLSTVSQINE